MGASTVSWSWKPSCPSASQRARSGGPRRAIVTVTASRYAGALCEVLSLGRTSVRVRLYASGEETVVPRSDIRLCRR